MGKSNNTEDEMRTERLGRELVCHGAILDYCHDKVKMPNGHVVTYDTIVHRGAAAVLPVTNDGKLVLVKQYRNALDRFTLEIPAGGLESADEPTIKAAERELSEETGYVCENIEMLISIYPTVAYSNEKIDIYIATGLTKKDQHLDEDEYLNVEEWDVDDITSLIYEGKIQDSKTIGAILAYRDKYLENRVK